jgi:AraC-like DNA-binding protein
MSATHHPQLSNTPLDGVQLMLAEYDAYRYDRHVHDTYSFGITLQGVQSFRCRGTNHANTPGRMIAFNPDEAHDGHPGNGQGFAYRMLWVEPQVLAEYAGSDSWAHFQQATFHDPALAAQFAQISTLLAQAETQESLYAQVELGKFLTALAQRHGRVQPDHASNDAGRRAKRQDPAIQKMRDYLQSHYIRNVKVQELADLAGVSRVHATRMFTSALGIAPHEYLNSTRVIRAKQMIKQGASLTQAAFDAGFSDQAHLSKRFKRSMGISPGQYQKILLTR